jgi:hypothetical protein
MKLRIKQQLATVYKAVSLQYQTTLGTAHIGTNSRAVELVKSLESWQVIFNYLAPHTHKIFPNETTLSALLMEPLLCCTWKLGECGPWHSWCQAQVSRTGCPDTPGLQSTGYRTGTNSTHWYSFCFSTWLVAQPVKENPTFTKPEGSSHDYLRSTWTPT